MSLNLDQLQTFVTVLDCGSFSAAAERLEITQPAVSQQIRSLERRLGVPLIERVGRSLRPTAAGAELLAHAGGIEASVAAALAAVAGRAEGVRGLVRLGSGATACIHLLPPLLQGLRRRCPELEITVSTGNTAQIARAVEDNQLDLGLVTLPLAGRAFEITPLLEDEFVAIAPAAMALPARVTARALAQRPLLLFEPGGNTRRLADAWLARGGAARLKPAMALGSVEAIKALVAAGLGCALVPGMALREPAARAGLQLRPLSPRLSRRLALVMRRDKRLIAPVNELRRALLELGNV